jgi:hypothetical protein
MVAKKMHYKAHFLIFHSEGAARPSISKMEAGRPAVPMDVTAGNYPSEDTIRSFVEDQNWPFISLIDSHNFKSLASLGRIMFLLVWDPSVSSDRILRLFDEVCSAVVGSHDRLLFGYVDGPRWKRFFRQYEVDKYPSVLLLDVPHELYATVSLAEGSQGDSEEEMKAKGAMEAMLRSFEAGELGMKEMKPLGLFSRWVRKAGDLYPYSLLALVPLFLLLWAFFTPHPDKVKGKKE